ncbi:MAG: thiamine pyrophosphate-binding protein [Caldilineaceae bacterium]
MPTVAEVLIDQLAEAGVEVIFGLPGGEVVEILDAIRRKGLRFVLTHNEASAVFMADALARMTGKPGVSLSTLGPGATNAVTGVAHAYLDRAPVIHITAQKPDNLLPDYTHQVLDLHALYHPITKGTFHLTAADAAATIAHAINLIQSGRPGPVHLQISNEEAGLEAREARAQVGEMRQATHRAEESLQEARRILRMAQRPVIVAGVGLEPEGPYDALRELAEAAQAPLIVTPKVKGALSDRHPLAAGTIGLTRTDAVYEILDEADCVIAVGFDVVELVKPWHHAAPLIWLAPWENVDPVLPAAVELVGPLTPLLQQLADSDFVTAADWGAQRVTALQAKHTAQPLPTPAPGRLLPQTMLAALRNHLPDDAMLAVDVGSHKIFSSLHLADLCPQSLPALQRAIEHGVCTAQRHWGRARHTGYTCCLPHR